MFRRNGHYRRQVLTLEDLVIVRVPLIRCRCGGYVATPWKVLPARQRKWFDVSLEGLRCYLAGSSYRKTADLTSSEVGAQVSHMAGWRDMQKAGSAARKVKVKVMGELACPDVVILDEMYVSVAGAKKAFLLAMDTKGHILLSGGPTTRRPEERILNKRNCILGRAILTSRLVSGILHGIKDGDADEYASHEFQRVRRLV